MAKGKQTLFEKAKDAVDHVIHPESVKDSAGFEVESESAGKLDDEIREKALEESASAKAEDSAFADHPKFSKFKKEK